MHKILIAEDDENTRELLERGLKKNGYSVETAANGEEALKKAGLAPPDLIISDVMMPVMDGFLFCRGVKADERLKHIPFILYTVTSTEKDETELAKNIGAARYLGKPAELKEILAAVSEELGKKAAVPAATPAGENGGEAVDKEYLRVLLRKLRAREHELETARAGLQESEDRLKKAQAMAHVGGWELDLRTNVLLASEEAFRIYGLEYDPKGLSLNVVQKAVLPEQRARLDQALKDLIGKKGGYDQEFMIAPVAGGELRHIHSKAELVCGADGAPLKVEGILQDVTEHKKAQEALRQAQKLDSIGQLSGGIAHDLNNLLGPILGYADFLSKSLEPGDQRLTDIGEIVKAADRAAGLVRKLLAFSRKQVMEPKVVELNDVISEMARLLERVVSERQTLRLTFGTGTAVKVDPGQLEQVLLNLVLNARDAMEKSGEIGIETFSLETAQAAPAVGGTLAPGCYVVLRVSDTGSGMDAVTQSKIFEPFFTTKGQGKGLGLGLPSVYGIVKQSGGEIQVESAPGKGAVFSIYFPCAQGAVIGAGAAAPMAVESGAGVVVVAEDDETMRRITRRILTAAGYSVLEAENGREALEVLAKAGGQAALLLTDIAMPEMDGTELSLEVFKRYPFMKVLCMSGYVDKEGEVGRVLGAKAEFIQKPFSPDALTRKVWGLLHPGK